MVADMDTKPPIHLAYWISPAGGIIPVAEPYLHHIDLIIARPEVFGYTRNQVEERFIHYREPLGHEGFAREELMAGLLEQGWLRLRFRERCWSWIVQGSFLPHSSSGARQESVSSSGEADGEILSGRFRPRPTAEQCAFLHGWAMLGEGGEAPPSLPFGHGTGQNELRFLDSAGTLVHTCTLQAVREQSDPWFEVLPECGGRVCFLETNGKNKT